MPMKIAVHKARELPTAAWDAWARIQESNPELESPYFRPEFTRDVAEVRKDVFVAVLGPPGNPVGFFPFQRRGLGFGDPVGSRLSDFHGLISAPGLEWDLETLMRACGLNSWEFHALVGSASPFAPHAAEVRESHFLDCSKGLEGYEEDRRRAGATSHKQVRSTRRKAEQKYSVEFVPHVTDVAMLEKLIEWKSRQHQEKGSVDNWNWTWMRSLMHRVHAHQSDGFAGMLSALYFDGEPAALHMGMRSRTAWHWWIPSFDDKFSEFRPGLVMLYYMIEAGPKFGLRRIDFGYGTEEYKRRLRSGSVSVAQGRVDLPSIGVALKRCRDGLERWVRRSPLMPIARYPGRIFRRLELWARFR